MERRNLGDTGIQVSVLCLGTMTWGQQNTEKEAHQQLSMAKEYGVNFIDTAELYPVPPQKKTQGKTEDFIGSWLRDQNRADVIIANKVTGPGMAYFRDGSSLTKKQIEQALDRSLKRLGTDYIDLYQLHWPQRTTNFFSNLGFSPPSDDQEAHYLNSQATLEESIEALDTLVDKGKIRAYGLSNETPWGVSESLRIYHQHQHQNPQKKWPKVASVQNPYNLLNRTYEVGMAEFHFRENIGLLAYSPLAFGMLTGKHTDESPDIDLSKSRLRLFPRFGRYTDEHAKTATRAYVELAREHHMSPTHMALAFVTQQPFLVSNIIGATTLLQLQENLESHSIRLGTEILDQIEDIHQIYTYPCP